MLPFAANEQVLYSAIPEMHSRHQCFTICAAQDCQGKKNQACNQSNHLSVLTGDINAHGPLSWCNCCCWTITSFSFFFLPSFFFREHKVRFTYLSICYYADYGNIFTWMPLDNSTKQLWRLCTMQENLRFKTIHIVAAGNCCGQIRLTLNVCFCAFWRHSAGLFV